MKPRKRIPMVKVYDNHDLDQTCIRLSRHEWEHKYQHLDPRLRRLEAARKRRLAREYNFLPPGLCNCTDDYCCEEG